MQVLGGLIEAFVGLIVFVILAIFLFFVFRAVVLWYWRINEAIDLLKSINNKLERLGSRIQPLSNPDAHETELTGNEIAELAKDLRQPAYATTKVSAPSDTRFEKAPIEADPGLVAKNDDKEGLSSAALLVATIVVVAIIGILMMFFNNISGRA